MTRLNVESYLAKSYHLKRYNCWHLAREAWLELTGRDIGDRTPEVITRAALFGKFDTDVPQFYPLAGPVEPSLVLMLRGRDVPHVGVYTERRVLQVRQAGVSYLPVVQACAGFEVRYYTDDGTDHHQGPAAAL